MDIQKVQQNYVQKSRMFLYPLLGITRGHPIVPTQTFMAWKNEYGIADHKLIAIYHMRTDKQFKIFEEKVLLQNPLFEDFFELEDGTGAYVFDFAQHVKDYKRIIHGKYSLLTDEYKIKVLQFFKKGNINNVTMMSYVKPKNYFSQYAKLLGVDVAMLKDVGELCNPPDLIQETLDVSKKVFTFELTSN